MNKNTLLKASEITIQYKPQVPASERPKINKSEDIYNLMKQFFDEDTICHREEFYAILLDSSSRVLGVVQIGKGGIGEVTVDNRIIFQTALKCNAVKIALAHNHPSENKEPSHKDKLLTSSLVVMGKLLNIEIVDHVIVTHSSGFYSFADEGVLN